MYFVLDNHPKLKQILENQPINEKLFFHKHNGIYYDNLAKSVNELEKTDEDELYKISVSDDYTEVNCQVAQKANGLTFTAELMIIFFNSEMYQILNGNAEWSIHVVAKDLSTGGELVNIDYPKEVFSITEETWDNL